MYEKICEISSISYQIRTVKESDLDSLLLVKNDVYVHTDRLRQQKNGKAVYLGAFINNCAVGMCYCHWIIKKTLCRIQIVKNVQI